MSETRPKILNVTCQKCGKTFKPFGSIPQFVPVSDIYDCPHCGTKNEVVWDPEMQREILRKKMGLGSSDDRMNQLVAETLELMKRLESFENKLTEVNNTIDNRMKETTEMLSKLLLWMKKYSPLLDKMDKEYAKLFGKGKQK